MKVVAETGREFTSFGPYVPAVNAAGDVAFIAELVDGAIAVVSERAGELSTHAFDGRAVPTSHPAFRPDGSVAFYAHNQRGVAALAVAAAGELRHLEPMAVGPLGPTCCAKGEVAIRLIRDGAAAIAIWREGGGTEIIAQANSSSGGSSLGFEGLPIATSSGVVYHSRTTQGCQIVRGRDRVVATGDRFQSLARFPVVDVDGAVTVAATKTDGSPVIVAERGGQVAIIYEPHGEFETLRGALCSARGLVVFGTPPRGQLGVYRLSMGVAKRVVGIGDQVRGRIVAELALNAVSINARGDLAIRLEFADGAGQIVIDS